MSPEAALREEFCRLAASMYQRGLTFGASGNLSVALPDGGWLMTPTGSTMGDLDPARLSKLAPDGRLLDGDKPTKESFLHSVFYRQRPKVGAVVHLHSTYSVAVSCMDGLDPQDVLPPLTPYYVMRVGKLPLVPYYPPGDTALAEAVAALAVDHHAVLLANHGPVIAGKSLREAVYAAEELEETAKLFVLLQGQRTRPLSAAEVYELHTRFPSEV